MPVETVETPPDLPVGQPLIMLEYLADGQYAAWCHRKLAVGSDPASVLEKAVNVEPTAPVFTGDAVAWLVWSPTGVKIRREERKERGE